jgi:hypothetical protein
MKRPASPVNAYRVTGFSASIHGGTLVLHSSQAAARAHRLTALGSNRYEVRDPPVMFKRREVFGIVGELPKGMESVEAIPLSALGKWELRKKKIFPVTPPAISKQQTVRARTRTAPATAEREAQKANRLRALKRFIDDVYWALDQAGHEIGPIGHRTPLPVSREDLHALFCANHRKHKVSRSTFDHDLARISKVKSGPKRYDFNQLAKILSEKITHD